MTRSAYGARPIDFAAARSAMVERQIMARGIHDARVLDAMRKVPREAFVPEALALRAYEDGVVLPIGEGQPMSQSWIVALMAWAAAITPTDRVLEVGAGAATRPPCSRHLPGVCGRSSAAPLFAALAAVR